MITIFFSNKNIPNVFGKATLDTTSISLVREKFPMSDEKDLE